MDGFNKQPPWLWEPNTTCWWQVPFIYMLGLAIGARFIVEIGVDQGYGAWHLAHLAKSNRGLYLGVDIVPVQKKIFESCGVEFARYFDSCRLPVKFLNEDSKTLTGLPIERVDLAFVDGEHTKEAVLHEVNVLLYPKAQVNGTTYICLHDIVDFPGVKEAWEIFKEDDRFQALEFYPNSGLGVLRVK